MSLGGHMTDDDWEELREKILASGVKMERVVACMPKHDPAEIMLGVATGIYPVRVGFIPKSNSEKSKYYRSDK